MKSLNHVSLRSRSAGLALALVLTSPALFAVDPSAAAENAGANAADRTASKIEDYRSDNSDMNKAEVNAALDQIDAELRHLDNLADAAPTAQEQDAAKVRYNALKERRNALKKDFNRARYEAFKQDLEAEVDKASNWAKQTFSIRPAANSAVGATSATANATEEKIADYRTEASDINKAEVKASLDHLDADISLLAAKIDAVTDPVRKTELTHRLEALKQRRSELGSEFRKARYNALVSDVKREWNELVN